MLSKVQQTVCEKVSTIQMRFVILNLQQPHVDTRHNLYHLGRAGFTECRRETQLPLNLKRTLFFLSVPMQKLGFCATRGTQPKEGGDGGIYQGKVISWVFPRSEMFVLEQRTSLPTRKFICVFRS